MSRILRPGAPLAAWQAWPYADQQWPSFNIESDQANGLVLWMPLGNPKSAGGHIERVRGLSFAENGTPTWIFDGERGWTLLFDDAATEYLQTSAATPVTGAPFTVAAWFNTNEQDLVAQTIVSIVDASAGNQYYGLRLRGNLAGDPIQWIQRSTPGIPQCLTTTGYTANKWHHTAAVERADNDHAVFIDGGSKGTNAGAGGPTGIDEVAIGRQGDNSPEFYFSGRITDVRIYNRALSDVKVATLHSDPWDLHQIPRRVWAVEAAVARRIFITHC